MGIPIIEVHLIAIGTNNTKKITAFLDTGAKISYLKDEFLQSCPKTGVAEDFYPSFGKFKLDLFEVSMIIGDVQRKITCGKLPSSLQGLFMQNTSGIIGTEFLKDLIIGFSWKEEKIYLDTCLP